MPKVTRKGGGAALPWRIGLFTDIVTAAVRAAESVPVTVKMRIGIDDAHRTYREAGLRAQEAGVRQVALHARTAAQFYGGLADWDAIADLTELLDVPVLGNGDIWEADDAVRMVHDTGCAGVVVGRGCLGRPWLFADLADAFAGRPDRARPGLATVASTMRRHAQLLVDWLGGETPTAKPLRAFAGTPKSASAAWWSSASTSPGISRASPSAPTCAAHSPAPVPWPNSTTSWPGSILISRSPRPCSGSRGGAPPAYGRSRCRPAG